MSPEGRAAVLTWLRGPAYRDLAVAQVWAILLDEGVWLCSQSTMHRLLREADENRDQRRQRTHPAKTKPHLVARGALQVWSWDVPKLPDPARGVQASQVAISHFYAKLPQAHGYDEEVADAQVAALGSHSDR